MGFVLSKSEMKPMPSNCAKTSSVTSLLTLLLPMYELRSTLRLVLLHSSRTTRDNSCARPRRRRSSFMCRPVTARANILPSRSGADGSTCVGVDCWGPPCVANATSVTASAIEHGRRRCEGLAKGEAYGGGSGTAAKAIRRVP